MRREKIEALRRVRPDLAAQLEKQADQKHTGIIVPNPIQNPVQTEWPLWVVLVALFRSDFDLGIGDTLTRELGDPRGEKFKAFHESAFGVWKQPCGCTGIVLELNQSYRY